MSTPADAKETLILIDENNNQIGTANKYPVHEAGLLHRAFSVFLFDAEGRMLLQKRAAGKYHSAGLWANSCCGHPRPEEDAKQAAMRRVSEELNITADLQHCFHARYQADLGGGMIENEFVHVFQGISPDIIPAPNAEEVSLLRSISLEELIQDIQASPEQYTYWLRHYIQHHTPDMRKMAALHSMNA